jgi:preprotein translocase subunit SecG
MSFLVGILTFFVVINCLLLILLVLIQLPKKDAGAGMAFGAGAADALFGAGSGNALTKITKYATIIFLVTCLVLSYIQDKVHRGSDGTDFLKQVQQQAQTQATIPHPASQMNPPPANNNNLLTSVPTAVTNAATATNAVK